MGTVTAWKGVELGIDVGQARSHEGPRLVVFLDPGRIIHEAGLVHLLVGTELLTLSPAEVRKLRVALDQADDALAPRGQG